MNERIQTFRPLNVVLAPGSKAERKLRQKAGLQTFFNEERVPGIHATPEHNLIFHGGKTIPHLVFTNFYLGGEGSWDKSDVKNIDDALNASMSDTDLNNVMRQYFDEEISSDFRGSKILSGDKPSNFSQEDVESLLADLYKEKSLNDFREDLKSTIFIFLLPSGSVLTMEDATSLEGLGGFHGSIHKSKQTLYYAIGVYSEWLKKNEPNGIPFFAEPWKNIVATFYHELNEARTDADVEDAIRASEKGDEGKAMKYLGWMSKQGEECGDFPIFEAGRNLGLVMKEVPLTNGRTVPVQLQYSNAVSGPEGPIRKPHST